VSPPKAERMSDCIRFWFRGDVREISDVAPTLSVLHWLREVEGRTGTKEGCDQGDCGACTVVIAELTKSGIDLHTANSCLLLMPMLHGRALFTIEDVSDGAALHPVQEALVELAGTQCGYCTPGFVMSMWCAAERARVQGAVVTREQLAADLSGNLCRCTGYRPILDAAVAAAAQSPKPGAVVLDAEELSRIVGQLDRPGTLHVASQRGSYTAPDTQDALARALRDNPGARLVAGGTDLVLAMRLSGAALRDDLALISTDRAGMSGIQESGTHLSIGAACRLEDAWAALANRLPGLITMWQRFASPAIRSVGTIGGNVATGSPVADLTPVLLALDAELTLRSTHGIRLVPLGDFMTGVRTNVLLPGEFISRFDIPLTALARDVRSHKVSRRFDDDISTVSGTFALAMDGPRIADVRVVLGGMATTVRRAAATEQVLRAREWNAAALSDAQAALSGDFTPISDHRASDHYRARAAAGLLHRWWRETGIDAPTGAADVWSYR
jgi:xanthine dehydrogenase small subunit